MTERIARLRRQSVDTKPSIDIQRALLITEAYASMPDGLPAPIARARSFAYICEHKDIYVGADDLIVGERGRGPKRTSTYPELTCHSVEDLRTLRSRPMTSYDIDDDSIEAYRERVIPYWRGRCIRDRAFADLPAEWLALYEAGVFTEFMESYNVV